MGELKPINGCVLVELSDSYQFVATPDKMYQTKTSGKVISSPPEPELAGKTVYFDEYKDGTQITVNDKTCAFIKYEDIRGYSD